MAGKSIEQRLADTEERIRQLEARKNALAQHLRQQERKERTRRLIQIGAIMAHLGVDTVDKAQRLQQAIERESRVKTWITRVTTESEGAEST